MKKKNEISKQFFLIGSKNVVSQILFFWVFSFILLLRKTKDLKDLVLYLKDEDTANFNDAKLEKNWEKEKLKAKEKNR